MYFYTQAVKRLGTQHDIVLDLRIKSFNPLSPLFRSEKLSLLGNFKEMKLVWMCESFVEHLSKPLTASEPN